MTTKTQCSLLPFAINLSEEFLSRLNFDEEASFLGQFATTRFTLFLHLYLVIVYLRVGQFYCKVTVKYWFCCYLNLNVFYWKSVFLIKSPDRGLSRSTPVTPNAKRKIYAKRPSINSNDRDSDGADIPDTRTANFKRGLLRQTNNRRVLTSTTTSAELIRHDDDAKSHVDDSKSLVASSSSEERAIESMEVNIELRR